MQHKKPQHLDQKKSAIKTEPLAQFYPLRANDFKNTMKNDDAVSLAKKDTYIKSREVKTVLGKSANHGAYGPHKKTSSKGVTKIDFLGPHGPEAYFAYEIMLRLKIRTPKARVVERKHQTLATRSIDGYITMDELRKGKVKLALDIDRQIIKDTNSGEEYKISGNLFAADIFAVLLNDKDFQPQTGNLGVKRVGNRFYAVAIDKEQASFTGKNYEKLMDEPDLSNVIHDTLFQSRTEEQKLFIIDELSKALATDESKECDIDRIFLNPRVLATPQLSKTNINVTWCDHFKKSAHSLIEYYKKIYGDNFLEKFSEEETKREQIANAVIDALVLDDPQNQLELKRIIMEDLRAPYYKEIKADQLVTTIVDDISHEFSLKIKTPETENHIQPPASKSRFWQWHDNLGLFGKILFWGLTAGSIAALALSIWGVAAGIGVAAIYGSIGGIFAIKGTAVAVTAGAAYSVGGGVVAGAVAGGVLHNAGKKPAGGSTLAAAKQMGSTPILILEEKQSLISTDQTPVSAQTYTPTKKLSSSHE